MDKTCGARVRSQRKTPKVCPEQLKEYSSHFLDMRKSRGGAGEGMMSGTSCGTLH